MRVIAALGLLRSRSIIGSQAAVRDRGDGPRRRPFRRGERLSMAGIAWAGLALQLLAWPSPQCYDLNCRASIPPRRRLFQSTAGCRLLTFVLARVFAEGTHARDLEGTV